MTATLTIHRVVKMTKQRIIFDNFINENIIVTDINGNEFDICCLSYEMGGVNCETLKDRIIGNTLENNP